MIGGDVLPWNKSRKPRDKSVWLCTANRRWIPYLSYSKNITTKKVKKRKQQKTISHLIKVPIPKYHHIYQLFGGFWKIWMMSLLCRNIFHDAKKSQRSKHFMYNLICYYIPTDWRVILLPFFLFQEEITFPTLLFLLIDVWIYDCKSHYTIHKFYLWTIKSFLSFSTIE